MSCRRMDRQLALYVGGDLTERAAAQVERHVGRCESCRERLASFEESRQSLFALKGAAGGRAPDLWPEIRVRITGRPPRRHRIPPRAAAAVFLAVGISLAFALLGPGSRPPPALVDPVQQAAAPTQPPPSGPGVGEYILAEVGTSGSGCEFDPFPSVRPVDPERRARDRF